MRFRAINLSILHVGGLLTGLDIPDWLIIFSFSITEELHFINEIHKQKKLSVHFIKKVPYDWSKDWRVTSELKLHQSMKHLTIQPRPLPGTIFECHENFQLHAITKVVKLECQKFQMYLIMLKCDYYFASNAIFWSAIGI